MCARVQHTNIHSHKTPCSSRCRSGDTTCLRMPYHTAMIMFNLLLLNTIEVLKCSRVCSDWFTMRRSASSHNGSLSFTRCELFENDVHDTLRVIRSGGARCGCDQAIYRHVMTCDAIKSITALDVRSTHVNVGSIVKVCRNLINDRKSGFVFNTRCFTNDFRSINEWHKWRDFAKIFCMSIRQNCRKTDSHSMY